MKIILVIPTLKQGGAERVISVLANEWAKKGFQVNLILLSKAEDFYSINKNIKVYRLGFVNRGKFVRVFDEYLVFIRLRKLFKLIRPEFVLSFMTKYNILTILASSFLNINIFVSDRSNPKKNLPFFIVILRKITYRFSNGIIAQTALAKELLEKETGNTNIIVIPNPLHKISISQNVGKEKIIISVGRLVPEKGQKFLIDAFSMLRINDWQIVILGDGPLKSELLQQISCLGLVGSVLMPGAVNNIESWLAKASIFAFPSISEGFPNALVEAMSVGLPCVCFDCDAGPRDIIKEGLNGYLVPVGDVVAFSRKLEDLMSDEKLRCRVGGEAIKVHKYLDIEIIGKKFLNFCN